MSLTVCFQQRCESALLIENLVVFTCEAQNCLQLKEKQLYREFT